MQQGYGYHVLSLIESINQAATPEVVLGASSRSQAIAILASARGTIDS